MLKLLQILCRPLALAGVAVAVLAGLAACGQRGPLYLPTGPGAAGRATLPQTLSPLPAPPAAGATATPPATAASGPAR